MHSPTHTAAGCIESLPSCHTSMCGSRSVLKTRASSRVHNSHTSAVQKEGEFEVVADVPGVQKGDINLAIDKDTLTISVSPPSATPATPPASSPTPDGQAAADEKTSGGASPSAPSGAQGAGGPEAKEAKEQAACGPKVLRRERMRVFAERALKFPDTAQLEGAKAECEGGVLRVRIPKKAAPQPSRIAIA